MTDATDRSPRRSASRLGRRLSRRLSLVTRVPGLISARLKDRGPPPPRSFEITAIAPDKTQRILPATSPYLVLQLAAPVLTEFGLCEYRLRLAGSKAAVDPNADVSLLEGDILLIDPPWTCSERAEGDARLRLTEQLWQGERQFSRELSAAGELWAGPLRRLPSTLSPHQHDTVFQGLAALAKAAATFAAQIGEVVENWNPETSEVGQLFSQQLWDNFEEYQDTYRLARELLREKCAEDEEFVEICKLRRGAALHTLESLLDLPTGGGGAAACATCLWSQWVRAQPGRTFVVGLPGCVCVWSAAASAQCPRLRCVQSEPVHGSATPWAHGCAVTTRRHTLRHVM
ncbi:uncharacterized protein LOC126159271 [Schistocerca cancellata]|uniref:uncharacterized protein LOC126159271 n=1 Tax=Schistocerca cancellata TaxID=274614 RepID=UPI00211800F2|nr:uncharacterized protein LOC126159271 [Schistocerca cancellata]